MKRSMCMFLLAAMMTTAAVAFAAKSPFSKERIGGCNSVCRTITIAPVHNAQPAHLFIAMAMWHRPCVMLSEPA